MLKFWKHSRRILQRLDAAKYKAARWWLVMTNKEQRDILYRGATLSLCAVGAAVAMPVISIQHDGQLKRAAFRYEARLLAEAPSAGAALRNDDGAPALLDHTWLRTVEYSLERDPRASLSRYSKRERDGAALATVASFRPSHMSAAEDISEEHKCLSEAVYYEARSERVEGQLAVAEVVLNRVADHRYPNSVCEVVYQGATRTTGCQFTFTCDGALNTPPRGWRWDAAKTVAAHVLMDLHERRTGAATHYHATYVDPVWNAGLIRTERIGTHIFYRFPRGGEWARVRRAQAERAQRDRRRSTAAITTISADAPRRTASLQAIEAASLQP